MAKIEKWICDIKDCKKNAHKSDKTIQVIFHTEQTEGTSSDPYLSSEKIDLCEDHIAKVLDGNYIHAHGAQGNNTFYFKD